MDEETFQTHLETLANGKIVAIGGRTAATVEELKFLREIEDRKASGGDGKDGTPSVTGSDLVNALRQELADAHTEIARLTSENTALQASPEARAEAAKADSEVPAISELETPLVPLGPPSKATK